MITLAREDDKMLRVNVIPTIKSGATENPALTTPLSYTGTPEELDAELGNQIASYVKCHCALGSTLASAKAEMDAAAKAAQEEARKKAEEQRKKVAEKPADDSAASATVSTGPRSRRRRACSWIPNPPLNQRRRLPVQEEEETTHAPG
jgi:PRTRC genetic system protein E